MPPCLDDPQTREQSGPKTPAQEEDAALRQEFAAAQAEAESCRLARDAAACERDHQTERAGTLSRRNAALWDEVGRLKQEAAAQKVAEEGFRERLEAAGRKLVWRQRLMAEVGGRAIWPRGVGCIRRGRCVTADCCALKRYRAPLRSPTTTSPVAALQRPGRRAQGAVVQPDRARPAAAAAGRGAAAGAGAGGVAGGARRGDARQGRHGAPQVPCHALVHCWCVVLRISAFARASVCFFRLVATGSAVFALSRCCCCRSCWCLTSLCNVFVSAAEPHPPKQKRNP